jgi:hypothetical protein
MKRSALLFFALLCLATSLVAQDSNKSQSKQVIGTICNSACVQPVNNVSTCNTSCTDKSGDVVLVDDQGKVMKIDNPKMAMPHMNKKVKCTAVPTEKQREEYLRIKELSEMGG